MVTTLLSIGISKWRLWVMSIQVLLLQAVKKFDILVNLGCLSVMVPVQPPSGWILMQLVLVPVLAPPQTVPLLMVWPHLPSGRGWMVQSSAVSVVGEMTSTCLWSPPRPPTMSMAG